MSVSASFSKLIERIQPLAGEIQNALSHSATIKSRLEKSFVVKRFDLIGSHSRETAIRNFSDVDFFGVFSRDDARWGGKYVNSRTLISRVRNCLLGRYPQTAMRRDLQALVIQFGGGSYSVDVVPAFFEGIEDNDYAKYPLYYIPDGTGNWLPTSPPIHSRFISESDGVSNSKLKKTIQLLKYWSASRFPPIPLQSFHLELLLSSEGTCQGVKSYAECLCDSFGLLSQRQCRPLRDPLGISGIVNASKTDQQREILYRAVVLAHDQALRAIDFEAVSKIGNAKGLWNTIFNGKFPVYG